MATSQTTNIVVAGATSTNTRSISELFSPQASSNLSIVRVRIPYYRRRSVADKTYLFFISELPPYLPQTSQQVLIHHLDVPASSALAGYLDANKSTNVATGKFVNRATMGGTTPAQIAQRDGFTYALQVTYEDDAFLSLDTDCNGLIEYDTSPSGYDILKPVESAVVVTERVPYDLSEGDNYLLGTTTGSGQTITNITPMLFVDRMDSNTIFSNLYKSFNLPITANDLKDFEQTELGYWDKSSGTDYYKGVAGHWVSGSTAPSPDVTAHDIIHPTTGYTGIFYGTVYQNLAYAGTGATSGRTAVDKVLVMEIPQAQYGEIIDGKSLRIKIPYATGATNPIPVEIYGAFKKNTDEYNLGKMDNYLSEHDFTASYFGTPANLGDTAYESNIVLLFSDTISTPTLGTSWSTGHDEVMSGEKVYNSSSTVKKAFFDFYDDQCVGIAYLDRGFAVITNPTLVTNVYNQYTGNTYNNVGIASNIIVNYEDTGHTIMDRASSQFLFTTGYTTGNTAGMIFAEFLSYNVEKSLNVVCLASANEFYRTTNETAKQLVNALDNDYAEFKNPVSGDLYPIVITEIGLHDAQGNLLAIVKPTEPIKKYWYDVVSFHVKIRL